MKFDHIGYIVKDGKKVAELLNSILGNIKWEIIDYEFPQESLSVGRAFTIRTYNACVEHINYEVIEPLCGEDSYFMKCVATGDGGIHHIAYSIPDKEAFLAKVEELLQKGYEIVHYSERVKGNRTCYVALPGGHSVIELKSF